MAVIHKGKIYGGVMWRSGVASYGAELRDVRDDQLYPTMDCKYCYCTGMQPLSSYEDWAEFKPELKPGEKVVVQALCRFCAAGLTPTEPVDNVTWAEKV